MNERIRELAEQAAQDTRIKHSNAYWRMQNEVAEDSTWREKFAELIIRECINIAYEHDKPKLSGPGLRIAMNIESHFDIYIEEDGRFVK